MLKNTITTAFAGLILILSAQSQAIENITAQHELIYTTNSYGEVQTELAITVSNTGTSSVTDFILIKSYPSLHSHFIDVTDVYFTSLDVNESVQKQFILNSENIEPSLFDTSISYIATAINSDGTRIEIILNSTKK